MRLLHPKTREENNDPVKKHPFYCYKAQLQFVGWLKQQLRRTDYRGQPGLQVGKGRSSWQLDKLQPRWRCIQKDKDSRSHLVCDPILLVLRSFLQRQSFQLAGRLKVSSTAFCLIVLPALENKETCVSWQSYKYLNWILTFLVWSTRATKQNICYMLRGG